MTVKTNQDIFISYSRVNYNLVIDVKQQIDQWLGTDCWIDLNNIDAGSEKFIEDIIKGIDCCKVFLFMLTKESQESDYALRELNYASIKNKHVVLVNINGCEKNDTFLFQYSLTDTIDWNDGLQRDKLIKDIIKWLNLSVTPSNPFKLRLFPFKLKKKYGYADEDGRIVIPCQWIGACDFSEGLAAVCYEKGKWGYIDEKGDLIIGYKWSYCGPFSEGLAITKYENGYGFIDTNGNTVIPHIWYDAKSFTEGLAPIYEGHWGFIDKTGAIVIPCAWYSVKNFSEGLAPVQYGDGRWGFVDKTGRLVIPCEYRKANGFYKNRAKVQTMFFIWKYIDKKGKEIKPL